MGSTEKAQSRAYIVTDGDHAWCSVVDTAASAQVAIMAATDGEYCLDDAPYEVYELVSSKPEVLKVVRGFERLS
jgi:hypothetical protein